MRKLLLIGLGLVMLMASFGYAADEQKAPASAQAPAATSAPPVAGAETVVLGVTVTELTNVVKGWSVKNKVMGCNSCRRRVKRYLMALAQIV